MSHIFSVLAWLAGKYCGNFKFQILVSCKTFSTTIQEKVFRAKLEWLSHNACIEWRNSLYDGYWDNIEHHLGIIKASLDD